MPVTSGMRQRAPVNILKAAARPQAGLFSAIVAADWLG